jgi:hypothetical protein
VIPAASIGIVFGAVATGAVICLALVLVPGGGRSGGPVTPTTSVVTFKDPNDLYQAYQDVIAADARYKGKVITVHQVGGVVRSVPGGGGGYSLLCQGPYGSSCGIDFRLSQAEAARFNAQGSAVTLRGVCRGTPVFPASLLHNGRHYTVQVDNCTVVE